MNNEKEIGFYFYLIIGIGVFIFVGISAIIRSLFNKKLTRFFNCKKTIQQRYNVSIIEVKKRDLNEPPSYEEEIDKRTRNGSFKLPNYDEICERK